MCRHWATICATVVLAVFLAVPAVVGDGAPPVRYDQHKLVWVQLRSQADIDAMLAISPDCWSDGIGVGSFLFRVPPERMSLLVRSKLTFRVQCENLQALIDQQRVPAGDGRGWFDAYKTLAEINQRLDELVALRPDLVTKFQIGTSIESRPIYGITIANDVGGPGKPAVLFNGDCHAREWITPMVNMYIADHLIVGYDSDPTLRAMVDQVTFYIVPVLNVDGYVYTWTTDRLWRKNRRDNGDGSFGIDLNRNWSYQWGGEGASHVPSDDTYCGTAPFSEPEPAGLRDFILAHLDIAAHIDWHNYNQYVMWPYCYAYLQPDEPDRRLYTDLGCAMATAIKVSHGMTYLPEPWYGMYLAAGTCTDWVYAEADRFSYTIELRDKGQYGFLLPPAQILPTSEESFAAARVYVDFAARPFLFVFPDELASAVDPNTATTLSVQIRAIGGTPVPETAKLHYRFGGGPFVETSLTPLGGIAYEVTLPAAACGGALEYYFSAQATTGVLVTSPEDAPATLHTTQVRPGVVVFQDDMETDQGWTTPAPGDTAPRGKWNRMDPEGTMAQPEDDHTPAPGTICWVTDGNAGSSALANDVDSGKTTVVSPMFDASQGVTTVGYWRWYCNAVGPAPNADTFIVGISNDGGTSWVNAEVILPAGPETAGGWHYHEFVVADVLAPTATMKLRFVASDLGADSLIEAALDDFRVVSRSDCPVVPGDTNCDGALNAFDIDPFALALTNPTAYATTHPGCNLANADINHDGAVDDADVDPFVTLLVGG